MLQILIWLENWTENGEGSNVCIYVVLSVDSFNAFQASIRIFEFKKTMIDYSTIHCTQVKRRVKRKTAKVNQAKRINRNSSMTWEYLLGKTYQSTMTLPSTATTQSWKSNSLKISSSITLLQQQHPSIPIAPSTTYC